MGYQGTTHASPNPPSVISAAGIWGKRSTNILTSTKIQGRQVWSYWTTDGSTELVSTAYFSDAQKLGMREGDLVMVGICTGSSVTMAFGIIGPVTSLGAGFNSTNAYVSSTR
jgi:hypothetical protein